MGGTGLDADDLIMQQVVRVDMVPLSLVQCPNLTLFLIFKQYSSEQFSGIIIIACISKVYFQGCMVTYSCSLILRNGNFVIENTHKTDILKEHF